MNDMPDPTKMIEAARLTRAGRLTEATALLQRMLQGKIAPDAIIGAAAAIAAGRKPQIIDVAATGAASDRPHFDKAALVQPVLQSLRGLIDRIKRPAGLELPPLQPAAPVPIPDIVPAGGKFIAATYGNAAGRRVYKLYIPSGYSGAPGQALPLIIMLHGCSQAPDDFAAGTRMNVIAEEQTCLVVYPAQPSDANPGKCWNWFRPGDQRRDQGEPSLIAGVTREVMREYAVDPRRVYIGGLSAGAAAAVVMGATYPDLYAAIGVHSGLACGAANDLTSAFTAMRQGELVASFGSDDILPVGSDGSAVPTIVFHGDRDTTVHPRNGDHVIAQSMRTTNVQSQVQRGRVPGGHAYTRTIHATAGGRAILEHWEIHGAGHAWSGGSPAGSYTDPRGPDAAREMLRFFLEHSLPA